MMDLEQAVKRLEQDRVLYANPLEILRRGSAEVLYAGADGLLLRDKVGGGIQMSAMDDETADRLLSLIPEGCDLFEGHELFYMEAAVKRLRLPARQICYSSAYLGTEALPIPPFGGELRLLTRDWAPWVHSHYSHSFGGTAYIEEAIDRGMTGVLIAGEPAGFVGFHDEGAIGMLEVLPEYRRRGLGEILQRAAVNLALSRGEIPFGQVFDDNAASLALQRKTGMTLSESKLFWIFPEEGS